MNKYYYMTQYDEFGMFDNDIIEILETNNQEVERESLDRLLETVPSVSDKYNQELYYIMMSGKLNNDNIDNIADVWEHLADGELDEAFRLLDIDYNDLLLNHDVAYYNGYELEDWADDDLRANGINANALYWYDEIDSRYIHVFNGYGNGFDYYDDIDDLLTYYFDDCIKDAFIEALKNE